MKERIRGVLSGVLSVPPETLSDEAGPHTIPAWDSLSHLNIVLALESEFGVTFSDEEITEMFSMALIHAILAKRVEK